ncbi:type VII secretion integral membrane protein EccD [Mycobacterium intracellulare]|uniref:type VII secretion integral membrane protein EccD n=1 Tax=Mycobacterium intracellulare TaxID=1767 RepID=UPI0006CA800D|nr:type VII secretion integral membrane protein EccD [Mycobacterium intracellulare]KPN47687.1 secretion protein snm4 [Mycobacterium intracellulare subsp. chimaera]
MTATAERRAAAASQTMIPASSRVSLLVGESHQIDLLLPAAVPLNKLAEPTRDAINQRLRTLGAEELGGGAFVFARAAGMTMLAGNLSLAAQGISDADLLAFVPAGSAQRYEPNIENVSAAIATWAKQHFPAVSARDAASVGAALTLGALAVSGLLLWRMRWAGGGDWLTPAIFGAAAAVLAVSAALAARMRANGFLIGATTWAGLAAGVTAAAVTPPGPHPGAPHAFSAAGVGFVAAAGLVRLTARHWIASSTVITVSVAVLGAATARMFFDVPGQRVAVVVLIGVLTASLAAPGIGRRLANVPRQSFESLTGKDMYERSPADPEDTISPVADSPRDITLTGEQVAQVARRSNRVLMGVLLGTAATQVLASWCAVHPGAGPQWPFVAVAACIGLIAVLRARAFRDRRHAITVVAGAALSLMAIPAHFGLAADPTHRGAVLWAAAAVMGIALSGLLAGVIVPAHVFSEPVREAAEYLEYVATAVVVVFAAWVIHLIQFVRYH